MNHFAKPFQLIHLLKLLLSAEGYVLITRHPKNVNHSEKANAYVNSNVSHEQIKYFLQQTLTQLENADRKANNSLKNKNLLKQ